MICAKFDSFSSAAAEFPPGSRSTADVLQALRTNPRVSTFDLSEHIWLANAINVLKRGGSITEIADVYPWHCYRVTA